jgi:predicted helicase
MRQLLSDIALIPDNDRRGKTFERAVKWLLENAPETCNQFKKVWLWDDYPDREGRDLGIDLVAETLQGTRWADVPEPAVPLAMLDLQPFVVPGAEAS